MNTLTKLLGLLLIGCLGSGCDNNSVERSDDTASKGAIPEHQLRALQQAKAIENKLLQADAERQQSLAR